MVESVRIGTVIASDKKALGTWRNRRYRSAQRTRGLTGQDLEAAVMGIATMFPANVSHGVMAAA